MWSCYRFMVVCYRFTVTSLQIHGDLLQIYGAANSLSTGAPPFRYRFMVQGHRADLRL